MPRASKEDQLLLLGAATTQEEAALMVRDGAGEMQLSEAKEMLGSTKPQLYSVQDERDQIDHEMIHARDNLADAMFRLQHAVSHAHEEPSVQKAINRTVGFFVDGPHHSLATSLAALRGEVGRRWGASLVASSPHRC